MSEWVNVKDRLPNNEIVKIVLMNDGSADVMHYDAKLHGWIRHKGRTTSVTHWMPFPPPPARKRVLAIDHMEMGKFEKYLFGFVMGAMLLVVAIGLFVK